jgi:hypothetical protein
VGSTKRLSRGIFASSDAAICDAFKLDDLRRLWQRASYRKIAARAVPEDRLVELVRALFEIIAANFSNRARRLPPSRQNWRWECQTELSDQNLSSEVLLERAIAILAEQGHLPCWRNQIPVASGLVSDRTDKRAAIDLARISDERLDLYELKVESDTPLYAAVEILLYGLVYIFSHAHQVAFDYAGREMMGAKFLGLNVLAPSDFYEGHDLGWLQRGLDVGLRRVSMEQAGPSLRTSFRFLTLPAEVVGLFNDGADVLEECRKTPIGERCSALQRALGSLSPRYGESLSD